MEGSSPQVGASETNPDFLFGLDKGLAPPPPMKLQDPTPLPMVPDVLPKDYSVRSDPGSEDCHVVGDPVVSPADFQRQIQMEQSSGDNGWFNGQIPFRKLQCGSMHLSCHKSFLYFSLEDKAFLKG